MEASHKTHRPHIKVGKHAEEEDTSIQKVSWTERYEEGKRGGRLEEENMIQTRVEKTIRWGSEEVAGSTSPLTKGQKRKRNCAYLYSIHKKHQQLQQEVVDHGLHGDHRLQPDIKHPSHCLQRAAPRTPLRDQWWASCLGDRHRSEARWWQGNMTPIPPAASHSLHWDVTVNRLGLFTTSRPVTRALAEKNEKCYQHNHY